MSSVSSHAARVFSGYRRLFRARRRLFRGDERALDESRVAVRAQFEANRRAATADLKRLLSEIDEAEDMMLNGVVQGTLNEETGNYQIKVEADHATPGDEPTLDVNQMEPITADTVEKLEGRARVEVTKAGSDGVGDGDGGGKSS